MIKFDPDTGTAQFAETPFDKVETVFRLADRTCRASEMNWKPAGDGCWLSTTDQLRFGLRLQDGALGATVENISKRKRHLHSVEWTADSSAIEARPNSADFREFINGLRMGSPSGVKRVGLPNRTLEANPESSLLYILYRIADENCWSFAGRPPQNGDYLTFRARHHQKHMEGTFGITISSRQSCDLHCGDCAETTPFECRSGSDPFDILQQAGENWAAASRPFPEARRGWNSWDYFNGTVTEKDCLTNLDKGVEIFGDRMELFVIDEGWENRWGDWTANDKFPSGLEGFCKQVRSRGKTSGIWTAPLAVDTATTVFRDHPEWFGRDGEGAVVTKLLKYGNMAILDPTHPGAAEFLGTIFSRLRQAGFEYFKVDFTQLYLLCSVFHDRRVPRAGILRRAFEIIRDAIGEESYLLACGAPLEAVTGLVDAVRVTGDIHTYWSHVLRNAANLSTAWWTGCKMWNIDPDFLVVRTPETFERPMLNVMENFKPFGYPPNFWLRGRPFNQREAETYALLAYLAGGELILGDDIPALAPAARKLLKKILEHPLGSPAIPLDLFQSHDHLPGVWLAEDGDRRILGVFNWEEDERELVLDLEQVGINPEKVPECLLGEDSFDLEDGVITVLLPPRGSAGLLFTN